MDQATILVVDDNLELLETVEGYLTRRGFCVVTATNGLEAFVQVMRWAPKAVILDLFMPRLGGLGALERIRRLNPGIVIILISGVPSVLEMLADAGVSVAGTLTKPFDLAQLLGTLVEAGVAPPRTLAEAPPATQPPAARSRNRGRVLIVEDEPAMQQVLITHLQKKGFTVFGVGSGEEALYRIPEFRPHIILLDITMPGLSGVETLRRIKALPQESCVIMVSGTEDMETARKALALGAADYLGKPVDFAYLDTALEIHLLTNRIDPEST